MSAAKVAKEDEFYTQLSDIERELQHYREHFRGKVVFCNCDDPEESNFWIYFRDNFARLGLKKLISTHYEAGRKSYKMELIGAWYNEQGELKFENFVTTDLKGDGDFRSDECIEILKEADIVVTNPPFSLFREYVAQLMEHGKKFLIIGNQNAITYKEIFPLLKGNEVWLGYGFQGGNAYFGLPKGADTSKYAKGVYDEETNLVKFRNCAWFTNLDHSKRHEELICFKKYTPEAYPHYENYDAINVSKLVEIPVDYDGVIGVPITFLDKHNPDQFEILGMCENLDLYGLKTKVYTSEECRDAYFAKFGKKGTYDLNAAGVLIIDGRREKTYQRLLIKRKH